MKKSRFFCIIAVFLIALTVLVNFFACQKPQEMIPTLADLECGVHNGYVFVEIQGKLYRYERTDKDIYSVRVLNRICDLPNNNQFGEKEIWKAYEVEEYPDFRMIYVMQADGQCFLYEYYPPQACSPTALNDAINDGYIIQQDGNVNPYAEQWNNFYAKVSQGKRAKIKIACYYATPAENTTYGYYQSIKEDYPQIYYAMLTYNGDKFIYESNGRKTEFQYLMEYSDSYPADKTQPQHQVLHYCLVNDNTLTWKQITSAMFSSQLEDHIPFVSVVTMEIDDAE